MGRTLETLLNTEIMNCTNSNDFMDSLKSIIFINAVNGHDEVVVNWEPIKINQWSIEIIDFPKIHVIKKYKFLEVSIIFEVYTATLNERTILNEFRKILRDIKIQNKFDKFIQSNDSTWRIEINPVSKLVQFYDLFGEIYMKAPIFWW